MNERKAAEATGIKGGSLTLIKQVGEEDLTVEQCWPGERRGSSYPSRGALIRIWHSRMTQWRRFLLTAQRAIGLNHRSVVGSSSELVALYSAQLWNDTSSSHERHAHFGCRQRKPTVAEVLGSEREFWRTILLREFS
jgi:hypothetical protein